MLPYLSTFGEEQMISALAHCYFTQLHSRTSERTRKTANKLQRRPRCRLRNWTAVSGLIAAALFTVLVGISETAERWKNVDL